MTKGKKHVISTLTYHSLPEIFFSLAKRNNCFTRSFHAFSFESEFAGGRAFARGPLFSKKKEKTKKKGKKGKGEKGKRKGKGGGKKRELIQPRTSLSKFAKN